MLKLTHEEECNFWILCIWPHKVWCKLPPRVRKLHAVSVCRNPLLEEMELLCFLLSSSCSLLTTTSIHVKNSSSGSNACMIQPWVFWVLKGPVWQQAESSPDWLCICNPTLIFFFRGLALPGTALPNIKSSPSQRWWNVSLLPSLHTGRQTHKDTPPHTIYTYACDVWVYMCMYIHTKGGMVCSFLLVSNSSMMATDINLW